MKQIALFISCAAILTTAAILAPANAADPWAGTYTGRKGSYRWSATITNKSAGLYALHVRVDSKMPACTGDTTETARLAGDRLVTVSKDCALTVTRRGARSILVDEQQCNDAHGVACIFSSELTRK